MLINYTFNIIETDVGNLAYLIGRSRNEEKKRQRNDMIG